MDIRDFTVEQLAALGALAVDMLDGVHDSETYQSQLAIRARQLMGGS